MTVCVVMAEIDGHVRLEGVYENHRKAEEKVSEIKNRNFFFEEEGDEAWIEWQEVQ